MINYGVIGCGMMGQEHLRNIALLPGARAHAIYEPDADMVAQALAIAPDLMVCDSLDGLLELSEVDCLLIASPNHLHIPQLMQVAGIRPLPILVEKPLYVNEAECESFEALQAYPAPIWVAMEYRYMPPIAEFMRQADTVTGGIKMLSIREHRFPFLEKVGQWNRFNRNTGGTLVEKCCHFFDLMRVVLKSDPVRIMCSAGQEVNHLDEAYDGERSDIWDSAYVIVDFASGARACLELCMYAEGARYQEEISAVGPEGKIEALVPGPARFQSGGVLTDAAPKVIVSPRATKQPYEIACPVDPSLLEAGDHNGATYYQHQKFLEMVRGRHPVEVGLEDGAWAVRMGLEAQNAARTRKNIVI